MASQKSGPIRKIFLIGIILLTFFAFAGTTFYYQIVRGAEYEEKSASNTGRTVEIPASRGEILDCNGVPLISNRQSNSIIFEQAKFPSYEDNAARNELIFQLITLFEEQEALWNDELPLLYENGKIVFAPDKEDEIARMKSRDMLKLNEYATAENCMDALTKQYEIEGYELEDARKIASVRYGMTSIEFSIANPYTFAEEVPAELVSSIKEQGTTFPGVTVEIVSSREYMIDGSLMPQILGRIAAIDAEEYPALKEKGYKLNELVGKSGIEAAMEDYLRGTPGEKTVTVNRDGSVTEEITKQPEQGNTIILSIDSKLQQATFDALDKYMKKKPVTYNQPKSGFAMVMDCNTGAILASVSYPTYDITTYAKNVAKLNNDPARPLYDRTLLGVYSPGSTIKPSVDIAALEEGIIDEKWTNYCSGYAYYGGARFKCENSCVGRSVNVVSALCHSCNLFHYELGNRLGIERMNEYRTLLGLGQKTGVELPESIGIMDSPEYRAQYGQDFPIGLTIQAAIAQGDNVFTPVQMLNYCATIANKGTRYVPHFVSRIQSSDSSRTLLDKDAEVALETGISAKTMNLIHEGMHEVSTGNPFVRQWFSRLDYNVAVKTGTNIKKIQYNGREVNVNNAFIMGFAPLENPEIAIFIGVDDSKSSPTGEIIRDIFEYYFSERGELSAPQAVNSLLG